MSENSPVDAAGAFLRSEFLQFTIAGTLQRNPTYAKGVSDGDRTAFRTHLGAQLERSIAQLRAQPRESELLDAIEQLSDTLSKSHGDLLRERRFRIGAAQKGVNLLLKYHWAAGWIQRPPHCPFDAIVIRHLPGARGLVWTRMDSMDEYERLVALAKQEAGHLPIAEWELALYHGSHVGPS